MRCSCSRPWRWPVLWERRRAPPGLQLPPLLAPWRARQWNEAIDEEERELTPRRAWPTWVLSNHDNPRPAPLRQRGEAPGRGRGHRGRRSEPRGRAAAALLFTLRGTPFFYQGEELGRLDAHIPQDRRLDPGGRDGCRAPIPWDGTPDHGWPTPEGVTTWLPFPPPTPTGATTPPSATTPARSSTSTVGCWPSGGARRPSPSATSSSSTPPRGSWPTGGGTWPRGTSTVLVNYTGDEVAVDPQAGDRSLRVELSSDGVDEGLAYAGRLGPDQALVLVADEGSVVAPGERWLPGPASTVLPPPVGGMARRSLAFTRRRPSSGVHHSTTSLVASASSPVMTTSVMSATNMSASGTWSGPPPPSVRPGCPSGDLGLTRPVALVPLRGLEGRPVEGEAGVPVEVRRLPRTRHRAEPELPVGELHSIPRCGASRWPRRVADRLVSSGVEQPPHPGGDFRCCVFEFPPHVGTATHL